MALLELLVSDTVGTTDKPHAWMPSFNALVVNLGGRTTINSLMIKHDTSAILPNAAPPKTINLPNNPDPPTPHFVVPNQ